MASSAVRQLEALPAAAARLAAAAAASSGTHRWRMPPAGVCKSGPARSATIAGTAARFGRVSQLLTREHGQHAYAICSGALLTSEVTKFSTLILNGQL